MSVFVDASAVITSWCGVQTEIRVFLDCVVRRITAKFCPNCTKSEETTKFGTKMHSEFANIDVRTISGGSSIHISLLMKLKTLKFLQIHYVSNTARKTSRQQNCIALDTLIKYAISRNRSLDVLTC